MAESITKIVHQKEQINPCLNWIDATVFKALESGPVAVTLGRPEQKRSSPANARFHAMIADINKQAVIKMPGQRIVMADYDSDQCKALLVIWFANERQLNGEPLAKMPRTVTDPTTGKDISIRPSTAQWGKRDTSDFIEFLYSLGADTGVRWSEPALKEYEQYKQAQ